MTSENKADDQPPAIVVVHKTGLEDLYKSCAAGEIPFSGPGSLYEKVNAMGYNCRYLYESLQPYLEKTHEK